MSQFVNARNARFVNARFQNTENARKKHSAEALLKLPAIPNSSAEDFVETRRNKAMKKGMRTHNLAMSS